MVTRSLEFNLTNEARSLGLTGVYFTMSNLHNSKSETDFENVKSASLTEILSSLSLESIETNQVLKGFRDLHEKVGCPGKKNISSPENLLLMLLEKRGLPNINLLVDIYNLVSVESSLAIGAHDISHISGNVHLQLTDGTESFWPLGLGKEQRVRPNEYAYVDDAKEIICRLETRQVEKTKITLDTKDAFYIVQGSANTDTEYLKIAAQRLIELTKRYCGGSEHILYVPGSGSTN